MISLILHHDPLVRDAFVRALSLEKKTDIPEGSMYQHGGWIFIALNQPISSELSESLVESYQPDRTYLPAFGRSIDLTHEEGDVILPNVFLHYDHHIRDLELDAGNRDAHMGKARFLDIYHEQRDYYVEDYGLSIGGIIVDGLPEDTDEDAEEQLMLVYEADVYVGERVDGLIDLAESDLVPTLITVGITRGKKPLNPATSVLDTTVRNMLTTWRLMEEDGESSLSSIK